MSRLRLGGIRPLGVIVSGVPLYRLSNLAASWQQGDFNEIPREPLRSLSNRRSVVVPASGAITSESEPVEISAVPVPLNSAGHAPVSARDHTRSLAAVDVDADADDQPLVVDVKKEESPADTGTEIASDAEPEAGVAVKPATPGPSPAPRRKTSRQGTRAARRGPATTGATTHSNTTKVVPDVSPEALSEK